ncbi:MAG: glycerol-3-phosphate 1-O-acyltransferase PlsY [Rhodocyclaceae bacterium]|nr:glycerol-3-phosphate 1-O-acyltransferase PlsY [Rhodocyclaceae bacterium]
MSSALPFALPILAYLIGSVSFAVLVSKLFGLHDPRRFGSGNPGATNVLRTGNKTAAVLTLLGDCLKGTVAVCLAKWLGADDVVLACVALAAFCGHVFSIFLRGKGGKGVATALGVLLGLKWPLAACALAVWLLVAIVTRYSSLAALLAALGAALAAFWLLPSLPLQLAVCAMAALLIYRHRANIARLAAGTEDRIGSSKKQ